MRVGVVLVLALTCAACAHRIAPPIVDRCTGWQPIYVSVDDVLTDTTAREILRHDEFGAVLGCWEPQP